MFMSGNRFCPNKFINICIVNKLMFSFLNVLFSWVQDNIKNPGGQFLVKFSSIFFLMCLIVSKLVFLLCPYDTHFFVCTFFRSSI